MSNLYGAVRGVGVDDWRVFFVPALGAVRRSDRTEQRRKVQRHSRYSLPYVLLLRHSTQHRRSHFTLC